MKNVTKYEFNERWREGDVAYESLEEELKKRVYPLLRSLARICLPENGTGRPPKVTPAKAEFLAAVKENGKENTYQELASSDYVEFLGIAEVHYTTIQKAIERLPPGLLITAMTIVAERASGEEMDCVFDATGVKIRKYETKEHAGEGRKKRVYTKLNAAWDADKRVFHAASVLNGRAHEYTGSEEMFAEISMPIRKLFADSGYAGRSFVQTVADSGAEPVVKPPENATGKTKGSPAWRKLANQYKELGYEEWRDETGYGKRFPNKGQFGALNTKFSGELNVKSRHMAERLAVARMLLQNFFQYLLYQD